MYRVHTRTRTQASRPPNANRPSAASLRVIVNARTSYLDDRLRASNVSLQLSPPPHASSPTPWLVHFMLYERLMHACTSPLITTCNTSLTHSHNNIACIEQTTRCAPPLSLSLTHLRQATDVMVATSCSARTFTFPCFSWHC